MRCPHCDNSPDDFPHKEVLPTYAVHNAESYGKPVMVNSVCCNKPIRVRPVVVLHLTAYEGTATEDDWGHPIKRT